MTRVNPYQYKSGVRYSTKNTLQRLDKNPVTSGIKAPTLNTEIATRAKEAIMEKLQKYEIVTFRDLSQCTYSFLRSTAKLHEHQIEDLTSFMWLIETKPTPLFPKETKSAMEDVDFLEKYPFNTKSIQWLESLVSTIRDHVNQTVA